MSPALIDGDYVIIKKARSLRPGFIYVIDHIDLGRIIKRLKSIENKRLILTGDNSVSTPENLMAPISPDRVIGQVSLIIGKGGIRRPRFAPQCSEA
ncbi:MAG: S24/S26 family peptidase [Hellea sp.]|nr:S24/S26 family peptidase [Hellea sp.]